jgi:signal transduction histidine kinase
MRNSLILKLIGAFLLVIAIGSIMISVLTSQATQSAFNLYTTRSGQAWAEQLAPDLAAYYLTMGSWQGVDTLLQTGSGGMMGTGPGKGGMGRNPAGRAGIGMMDQRLVLADARGVVVSDTSNELVGKQLSNAEIKIGAPILVNNALVGTLMVAAGSQAGPVNLSAEFLASVNQAIISSAGIAGIIALILGAVLSFQITAPLRQLKKAAAAIAQGDLNQRVAIASRDELGELGLAFNRMAENLSSAETQRLHLTADIAHELRTPLAAMQGTLEGLQDGVLPLDQEQLAALHSETLLLNRLVGDLRLISLAEAGQLKLERQAVSPNEWMQGLIERMRSQAGLQHVQLRANLEPGLPDLWIDSDRITQVLNNLVANALRYTPAGGSIDLTLTRAGDQVRFAVEDSGPGIAAEALPHIFARFYRADTSRTRASGGSGLGLAIVKQLVEAHGGRVWAESPVVPGENGAGFGTRVCFTLPVEPK